MSLVCRCLEQGAYYMYVLTGCSEIGTVSSQHEYSNATVHSGLQFSSCDVD